jgi:hypothetical protein
MIRARLTALALALIFVVAPVALTVPAAQAAPQAAPLAGSVLCSMFPEGSSQRTACETAAAVGKDIAFPGSGLASQVFRDFTPTGIIEDWATGLAQGSASMLEGMQLMLLGATMPDLSDPWFRSAYAITFGLGLVATAFALLGAASQMAAGGDPTRRPDVIETVRSAGLRMGLFVPMVVLLPFLVSMLSNLSYRMAATFGAEANKDASNAIEWYVTTLANAGSPDEVVIGGALGLMFMSGVVFIAAFTALVELTIAEFGLYLVLLIMPVLLALGVNPKWRRGASMAGGALAGILLVPVLIFFSFWVLWGMVAIPQAEDAGPMEVFRGLLLIGAGALLAVAVPVLIGVLLPYLATGGNELSSAASSAGYKASGIGSRLGGAVQKMMPSGGGSGRSPSSPGWSANTKTRTPGGSNSVSAAGSGTSATSTAGARSTNPAKGKSRAGAEKSGQPATTGAGAQTVAGAVNGPREGAQAGMQAGKVAGPKGMAAGAAVGAVAGAVAGPVKGATQGAQAQAQQGLKRTTPKKGSEDGDA